MKTISYYELLEMVKEDNFPERIKVNVCNYPREYVAEYDGDDFCHYEIENKRLQDDNYKLFLSECFIESTMFDKCIEIIEEVEEDEFEDIEKTKSYEDFEGIDDYIEHLKNKINSLIKNQKKIIEQLKNKD